MNVFTTDITDLVIDINGYYAAQSGITLDQGSAGANFGQRGTTAVDAADADQWKRALRAHIGFGHHLPRHGREDCCMR